MDVQAASATATILPPATAQVALLPAAPAQPQPDASGSSGSPAIALLPPVSGSSGSGSSNANNSSTSGNAGGNPAIGQTPGLATLPAGPPDGSKKGSEVDQTIAGGVAKLFNVPGQNVSVSFQIEQNPNEIVTVFTDKQTGKVIVQFPSETLIALAKLFDKLDGSVVNKKV
jgi:flagellar protein FlaG